VASTDTGHTGPDASFAIGHPEKLIDFGYRSVHETAVQGKATVAALYGTAPRFSYFNGCSGGGRQSFMEAQRYPADFDAIIAGAPGYDRTHGAFQSLRTAQATHKSAESFIPATKYPAIHRAAVNACDQIDGLKDGLITDPTKCKFDPAVLACKAGTDDASCLTPAQVTAAKTFYEPVIDPKTGKQIFAGLQPGSEMHWAAISGKEPHPMYYDLARFIFFQDPNWDFKKLDVSQHLELARKADGGVLSATSTDLKPFVDRGGKLLIYHGWEDQNISPTMSVDYYNAVVQRMGQGVRDSVRLFMVPGMGHCGGGDGPNTFDMIKALEMWREHGHAPDSIVASKVEDGQVTRTRPLCPYPQVAKYKGTGSIDRAESFACSMP
jgi:feruloyl esterase